MTTFVLLHGAGGRGAQWDLVAAHLRDAGHDVVAVDLPCDRPVGLDAYVDAVVEAVEAEGRADDELVVVAQSLAGFVAPLVCERLPVATIVLLAAMVPSPGESGGDWWRVTGHADALARRGYADLWEDELFVHDVAPDVLAAAAPPRDQTGTLFEEPWPLSAWPAVPTAFVLCRDDRFFPREWLRALVVERLGIEPVEIPGGHCAYLSQPAAVADAVLDAASSRRDEPGRFFGHHVEEPPSAPTEG